MKKIVVTIWLAFVALGTMAQGGAWQSLFDGKSLKGWKQLGGTADFRVEKGAIVGTTAPNTPNSFLCTEREYGNFILELEFKVDEHLNSGVQFRSRFVDGLVRGYQYEIDPDRSTMYKGQPANRDAEGKVIATGTAPRSWTGGIYDEKRRGWIGDLSCNPAARAAFKPGKWNKLRIEARKDLLKTWINGIPAATVVDYMTPSGFIALQVHAVPEYQKMEISWRKIRIMDLGENRSGGDPIDLWLSEWKDDTNGFLAQIWKDKQCSLYQMGISNDPYANKPWLIVLEGEEKDGELYFSNDEGWTGRLAHKRLVVHGPDFSFAGQRIHRVSPTLGMEPPKGAEVLFDGEDVAKWGSLMKKEWLTPSGDAAEAVRLTEGGEIEIIPGKGSIITRDVYGDFNLHLEFRLLGEKTNGGVYLQSRYEFNIKDSWGQGDGASAGALGNVAAPQYPEPAYNYALPPWYWQTLDIDFKAPRFDTEGKKIENARATCLLNGELIYEDIEIEQLKGAAGRLGEAPLGPIYLQEHGTAYQFRNIWIQQK